jgi:osmotically-inducible protein OsmY
MKTDQQIFDDVTAQLQTDPSIKSDRILVAVKEGVVTLAGQAHSFLEKWTAEKIVKKVAGVRAIANEIAVLLDHDATRTDQEIAEAALTSLRSNISVPYNDIKVIVHDGWLMLEGRVEYWYQRNAVENALRQLPGVKGITNDVSITPRVFEGDIRGRIKQAFKRHAGIDAERVKVSVVEGVVTLTGEVETFQEVEDAESAAWTAPGVATVQNQLSVHPH